MEVNLIGAAIIGGFFAVINYRIRMIQIPKPAPCGGGNMVMMKMRRKFKMVKLRKRYLKKR